MKAALLPHLVTRHKIPHYDVCSNSAEYSSRLRSSALPLTAGCVKLLHTFHLPESQAVTVLTYIFMDTTKNLLFPQFRTLSNKPLKFQLRIWNTDSNSGDELGIGGRVLFVTESLDDERESKLCTAIDLESLVNKFAFEDKTEEGHRLLHYRLTIDSI